MILYPTHCIKPTYTRQVRKEHLILWHLWCHLSHLWCHSQATYHLKLDQTTGPGSRWNSYKSNRTMLILRARAWYNQNNHVNTPIIILQIRQWYQFAWVLSAIYSENYHCRLSQLQPGLKIKQWIPVWKPETQSTWPQIKLPVKAAHLTVLKL